MKRLIAVMLLCLPLQAMAMSVSGVDVADKVRVGSNELLLNGAGLRSKFFFRIYVAGLYLSAKKTTAADVLSDTGPKRVMLHMMRKVNGGEFMEAFNKAVNDNQTPEEYVKIAARLIHFSSVFREIGEVNKGDVITLDYFPDAGTVLRINGKEQRRVKGADFYAVLLKVWLGEHPVQINLKQHLLGG